MNNKVDLNADIKIKASIGRVTDYDSYVNGSDYYLSQEGVRKYPKIGAYEVLRLEERVKCDRYLSKEDPLSPACLFCNGLLDFTDESGEEVGPLCGFSYECIILFDLIEVESKRS